MDSIIEKIKKYIIISIQKGDFSPNQKYLSAKQIAIKFSTSKQTALKALAILNKQGILKSKERQGFFVKHNNLVSPIDFFGINPYLKYNEIQTFNINIKENPNKKLNIFLKKKNINISDFTFFKKENLFKNKIIKAAYIGIPNKWYEFYEKNKEELSKNITYHGKLRHRSLFGLLGFAVQKRKDYIFDFDNFFEKKYSEFISIISLTTCDKKVIEISFSFVNRNHFIFVKKQSI